MGNAEMKKTEWDTEIATIRRYQTGRDWAAREALLERHLGLVHVVARRMIRGMPESIELDDLVGMGVLGLMQAVDQFDPDRGLAFSTYAVPRVRGAILDELRRQDWVPRAAREHARRLSGAQQALRARLGRSPTPAEAARALAIDIDTYWRWREEADGHAVVGLDSRAAGEMEGVALHEILPDPDSGRFLGEMDAADDATCLREALDHLPVQDRTVLALYYYEELTLREIGTIMGLTESRISQIRTRAVTRLRVALAPLVSAA